MDKGFGNTATLIGIPANQKHFGTGVLTDQPVGWLKAKSLQDFLLVAAGPASVFQESHPLSLKIIIAFKVSFNCWAADRIAVDCTKAGDLTEVEILSINHFCQQSVNLTAEGIGKALQLTAVITHSEFRFFEMIGIYRLLGLRLRRCMNDGKELPEASSE